MTIDSKSFWGSTPPSVFVGRYGYPKVNIGPVLPPVKVFMPERLEETHHWHNKTIEDIIGLRSSLYRSKKPLPVKKSYEPRSRYLSHTQELALSVKSVDTEIHLNSLPKIRERTRFDTFSAPLGPSLDARRIDIGENPKVPKKLDDLTSDIHATAVTGIEELWDSDISVNHIQRVLSAGLLGRAKDRKLVPTRWSITAVDDNIGKKQAEIIKNNQELGEIRYYHHVHFGNSFHVLLIPGVYSFELVEAWLMGAFWSPETVVVSDFEPYGGRKSYADKTTGAYYAARLSVLDYLKMIKRQSSILVYREISEKYWAPLGVWVIRDGVKLAMEKRPTVLPDMDKAVEHIISRVEVKNWWIHSNMLRILRTQKKIDDFI